MAAELLGIIIFLKIYLLKKEEEEKKCVSAKKAYITCERQVFGEFTVKTAGVTQREFNASLSRNLQA